MRFVARDGVPDSQISIVDALLRVQPVTQNIVGCTAAESTVFFVQLRHRLLAAAEKQGNDLFILHLHQPPFTYILRFLRKVLHDF